MLNPEYVWLVTEAVDLRAGIDTLTQKVASQISQVQAPTVFVFCNKARSRVKVLYWDKHGVWLCLRRLHQGHFTWPKPSDTEWKLSSEQFNWLIKGVNWVQVEGQCLKHWEI